MGDCWINFWFSLLRRQPTYSPTIWMWVFFFFKLNLVENSVEWCFYGFCCWTEWKYSSWSHGLNTIDQRIDGSCTHLRTKLMKNIQWPTIRPVKITSYRSKRTSYGALIIQHYIFVNMHIRWENDPLTSPWKHIPLLPENCLVSQRNPSNLPVSLLADPHWSSMESIRNMNHIRRQHHAHVRMNTRETFVGWLPLWSGIETNPPVNT